MNRLLEQRQKILDLLTPMIARGTSERAITDQKNEIAKINRQIENGNEFKRARKVAKAHYLEIDGDLR